MKYLLLTIVCIASMITGYTQQSNTPETIQTSNWKTHQGAGFSIQYPNNWTLDESGSRKTFFILFAPVESEQDKFRENVNFISQDLSGQEIDLDKYVEISEAQIPSLLKNGSILESKRVKTESDTYHHIKYSGQMEVGDFVFEQFYWVKDGFAYVLTYTCEQSKYEQYKEAGKAIMHSFVFKK